MGGKNEGVVWYLRTSEETLGAVRIVVVEGRVSKVTAPELGRLLSQPHPNVRGVIVDLAAVDYVNGAGLRVFEAAAERFEVSHTELVVCGLRPAVHTAFDLAGAIPNLAIAATRDAALRRFENAERTSRSAHS
jgi:anti-anti-sigma factor